MKLYRFLLVIFICLTASFSNVQAENIFRPNKNVNTQQLDQYTPPMLQPLVTKIRQLQAEFLSKVNDKLRDIKRNDSGIPIALLFISFLYGLLHAAGPGHGKAVITAYVLSTKAQTYQGIQIAFFASLMQAVVAIIIVFGSLFILNTTIRGINQRFVYFEQFSYILIASLGLFLLISSLVKIYIRNPKSKHHVHDQNCGCGHNHIPAPQQTLNIKQKLLTIVAIGVRPCTGALLILVLAHSLGLYWTAIFATLLMAFGTFTTIALVATFAVFLQSLTANQIFKLSVRHQKYLVYVIDCLKVILSLFILILGILLILATL